MSRWALIMRLSDAAIENQDSDLEKWSQSTRATMLRSLHQVKTQEMEWLVHLSIAEGGDFLKEMYVFCLAVLHILTDSGVSLYPQLEVQRLPVAEFWAPFLRRLYEERDHIVSAADPNAVCTVVNHRIGVILAELPAFPRKMVNGQERADVQMILDALYLCIETDNLAFCASIAKRMRDNRFKRLQSAVSALGLLPGDH